MGKRRRIEQQDSSGGGETAQKWRKRDDEIKCRMDRPHEFVQTVQSKTSAGDSGL